MHNQHVEIQQTNAKFHVQNFFEERLSSYISLAELYKSNIKDNNIEVVKESIDLNGNIAGIFYIAEQSSDKNSKNISQLINGDDINREILKSNIKIESSIYEIPSIEDIYDAYKDDRRFISHKGVFYYTLVLPIYLEGVLAGEVLFFIDMNKELHDIKSQLKQYGNYSILIYDRYNNPIVQTSDNYFTYETLNKHGLDKYADVCIKVEMEKFHFTAIVLNKDFDLINKYNSFFYISWLEHIVILFACLLMYIHYITVIYPLDKINLNIIRLMLGKYHHDKTAYSGIFQKIANFTNHHSDQMLHLQNVTQKLEYFIHNKYNANNIKYKTLSGIRHRFRTLIYHIIGSNQFLQSESGVSKDSMEFIDKINESSQKLLSIIDNEIGMVDLESSEDNLDISRNNIKEIIENVLDSVNMHAMQKDISLTLDLSSNLPDALLDTKYFMLALKHIVLNAVKFNNQNGYVKIFVNRTNKGIIIEINDSGCGMSEDFITKIKMMHEEKKINRKKPVGSGLEIVQNIFFTHGIEFEIESKPNVGTKVIIIIPNVHLVLD